MEKGKLKTLWPILPIFIWLCMLIPTDSYYSVYILIGVLSTITVFSNSKKNTTKTFIDYLFPTILSLFVTLANYSIYDEYIVISLGIIFISGFFVFSNLFNYIKNNAKKTIKKEANNDSFKYAVICFVAISVVNVLVLLTCCFPGILTSDSMSEIEQLTFGRYNNHHPVYLTFLIKAFVSLGLAISNDINIGVMLYSLFQIIVLAAAFSYSIYTLRQIGTPKKIVIALIIFTVLMPYNIMYSFTLWKDVMFGASMLILVVSLYRYFNNLYKFKFLPILLIVISGLMVCLFRSNGLLAFFVSSISFLIIFRKEHLQLGLLLVGITVLAFILKNPVLKALDIRQPDTVESLSIPMQQVTRVLVENKNSLSQEDIAQINKVGSVDRFIEEYNPILHDPIKDVVRKEGDQNYLKEHLPEFAGLYIKLGFQHPLIYTKAWINQTRGYWNGGYAYWRWTDELFENNIGIKRTITIPKANNIRKKYLESYNALPFLNPFISIGLSVWILLALLYKTIIAKNKYLLLLLIPLLTTWLTLLIATPVFSEFRYVYFLFTCLPFLIVISQINNKTRKKNYEKR